MRHFNLRSLTIIGLAAFLTACPDKEPQEPVMQPPPTQTTASMKFDPSQAVSLTTAKGAVVELGANTLVTASGNNPTGIVSFELAAPLSADSTPDDMPGGFGAIDQNGNAVTLVSYGFIDVSLTDEAGEKLDLREGVNARIVIPAIAQGPSTVSLWWLDESEGVWNEEGTADFKAGYYEGTVSHFSSWNVDGSCDQACVTGRILDKPNGSPVSNTKFMMQLKSTTCSQWRSGALTGESTMSGADGSFKLNRLVRESLYEARVDGTPLASVVEIPGTSTDCVDLGDVFISSPGDASDGGVETDAGGSESAYVGAVWRACSNAADYKDGLTKSAGPSSVICETVEADFYGWIIQGDGTLIRPGYGSSDFVCDQMTLMPRGNNLFESSCEGLYQHSVQGEYLRVEIKAPQAVGVDTVYMHLRREPASANPCTTQNTEVQACPTF